MSFVCAILTIGLLVVFSMVNLFLPYALLVGGLFAGLFYACGIAGKSRKRECVFGFC